MLTPRDTGGCFGSAGGKEPKLISPEALALLGTGGGIGLAGIAGMEGAGPGRAGAFGFGVDTEGGSLPDFPGTHGAAVLPITGNAFPLVVLTGGDAGIATEVCGEARELKNAQGCLSSNSSVRLKAI